MGSNNQTMNVMVDTGSSWLWVPSSNLVGQSGGTHRFDCNSSTTCNVTDTPVNISYSASDVSGTLSYDEVNMGNGMIIQNQGFVLINYTSNDTGIQSDGFWGLTPQTPTLGIPTIMDNLKTQGYIEHRNFAIFLSNNPNGADDDNSSIIIGGYDPQYMLDANFTVVHLYGIEWNYWTMGILGISLGTIPFNLTSKLSILDCGAAYIFFGANDWPEVLPAYQLINPTCAMGAKSLIYCDCASANDTLAFPSLSFTLGNSTYNNTFTLPPENYIARSNGTCTLLLQSKPGSVTRLGMAFARSFYLNYNIDDRTLGFARANQTFSP